MMVVEQMVGQADRDDDTDVDDDLDDDDENANPGAAETRRNQTTAVILLGVMGALFDLEAEKEGAGESALALGMHMTRLTAKALMYLVLCSSPSSGFYNPGQNPSNTQINSQHLNSNSHTGSANVSVSSNSGANSSQGSNSTTPSSNVVTVSANSANCSTAVPLKQAGAKSALRRAAIGMTI